MRAALHYPTVWLTVMDLMQRGIAFNGQRHGRELADGHRRFRRMCGVHGVNIVTGGTGAGVDSKRSIFAGKVSGLPRYQIAGQSVRMLQALYA